MGHGVSEPVNGALRTTPTKFPDEPSPDFLPQPEILEEEPPDVSMLHDIQFILRKVSYLPLPTEMSAIACLSTYSAPLIATKISGMSTVSLSQIAISRLGMGRLMMVGNVSFFSLIDGSDPDRINFAEQTLRWIGGPLPFPRSLALLNFPQPYKDLFTEHFFGLGFSIESIDSLLPNQSYNIIVCRIQDLADQDVISFIFNGGGAIICGPYSQAVAKQNRILARAGLAFLPISLQNPTGKVPIDQSSLQSLFSSTLPALVEYVSGKLREARVDIQFIKPIINLLTSHLEMMNQNECDGIGYLYDNLLSTLLSVNLITDDGVSVTKETSFLFELFNCLIERLPPHSFEGSDLSPINYRQMNECETTIISLNVSIDTPEWYDTGLWLQPGNVLDIQASKIPTHLLARIGCQTHNLVKEIRNWKRMPMVSLSFPIESKIVEICSPFGGIIFLVPDNEFNYDGRSMNMTFADSCKYPCFEETNQAKWQDLFELEVPWGAISTQFIRFYAPTNFIRAIPNLQGFFGFISPYARQIFTFLGQPLVVSLRVVIDIDYAPELNEDTQFITIDVENAGEIFGRMVPNTELFNLCTSIASFILRSLSFPSEKVKPLSVIAAVSAFTNCNAKYEEFAAVKNCKDFPELQSILSEIGANGFSKAFIASRRRKAGDENSWDAFVRNFEKADKPFFKTPQLEAKEI